MATFTPLGGGGVSDPLDAQIQSAMQLLSGMNPQQSAPAATGVNLNGAPIVLTGDAGALYTFLKGNIPQEQLNIAASVLGSQPPEQAFQTIMQIVPPQFTEQIQQTFGRMAQAAPMNSSYSPAGGDLNAIMNRYSQMGAPINTYQPFASDVQKQNLFNAMRQAAPNATGPIVADMQAMINAGDRAGLMSLLNSPEWQAVGGGGGSNIIDMLANKGYEHTYPGQAPVTGTATTNGVVAPPAPAQPMSVVGQTNAAGSQGAAFTPQQAINIVDAMKSLTGGNLGPTANAPTLARIQEMVAAGDTQGLLGFLNSPEWTRVGGGDPTAAANWVNSPTGTPTLPASVNGLVAPPRVSAVAPATANAMPTSAGAAALPNQAAGSAMTGGGHVATSGGTQGALALAPVAAVTPATATQRNVATGLAEPARPLADVTPGYSALSPGARKVVGDWITQTGAKPSPEQIVQLGRAYEDWQSGKTDISTFVRLGAQIQTAAAQPMSVVGQTHSGAVTAGGTHTANVATGGHIATGGGDVATGNVTINAGLSEIGNQVRGGVDWLRDMANNPKVNAALKAAGLLGTLMGNPTPAALEAIRALIAKIPDLEMPLPTATGGSGSQTPHVGEVTGPPVPPPIAGPPSPPSTLHIPPLTVPHIGLDPDKKVQDLGGGIGDLNKPEGQKFTDPYAGGGTHIPATTHVPTTKNTTLGDIKSDETQSPFASWVQDYLRARGEGVAAGQQDFGQAGLFPASVAGLPNLMQTLQTERNVNPTAGAVAPAIQAGMLPNLATMAGGNLSPNLTVGSQTVTPSFGALPGATANALTNISAGNIPASGIESFVSGQQQGRATGTVTPTESMLRTQLTGNPIANTDITNRFLQPGGGVTTDLQRSAGATGPQINVAPVNTAPATGALNTLSGFAPTGGTQIVAPPTTNVAPLNTNAADSALSGLGAFNPATGASPITAPNVGINEQGKNISLDAIQRGINNIPVAGDYQAELIKPAGALGGVNTQVAPSQRLNQATAAIQPVNAAVTVPQEARAAEMAGRGRDLIGGAQASILDANAGFPALTNPGGAATGLANLKTATATPAAFGQAAQVYSPPNTGAAVAPLQQNLNFGQATAPLNKPLAGVAGAAAPLQGTQTGIAASPYAAQAASALATQSPEAAATLQNLIARSQGIATSTDTAYEDSLLDAAKRAMVAYDRADPLGFGSRGLTGSGIAEGVYGREAARVMEGVVGQIVQNRAQGREAATGQLLNLFGQDLSRAQGQAQTLSGLAGMDVQRVQAERQLENQRASQLGDIAMQTGQLDLQQAQALADTLVKTGAMSLEQAQALSGALTTGQGLNLQQQQALSGALQSLGAAEMGTSQQNVASELQRLGQLGGLSLEGATTAATLSGNLGIQQQQLAQQELESLRNFTLGAAGLTADQQRAMSNALLQAEQLAQTGQIAGIQAELQKLTEAGRLYQNGMLSSADLMQRVSEFQTSIGVQLRGQEQQVGVQTAGLSLEAQTAEAQRQNQVSALRLQAQQAEASGQIDLANTLNQQANQMASTALGAAGLSVEAQTAEAQRQNQVSALRLQAQEAAATGNIQLASLLNQQAELMASTQLSAAQLGLTERMGAQEQLVGAGENEAARALQRSTAQAGATGALYGQESQNVEQALAQLGAQGEGAAGRALQGQLGAAEILAGREATGAQFALGSAQMNADLMSGDANRRLNAQQTASQQMIQLSDQIQSGEISRAQLTQMAKEGNLDGILNTAKLLSDAAAQREDLSLEARSQGIQMANVLGNYQVEQEKLVQSEKELDAQIEQAKAVFDFSKEQALAALKSDVSESRWAAAGQVFAAGVTIFGSWLSGRNKD